MNDFQERMDSFKDESRRICDQKKNNCHHDDDYCYNYENDSCDRRPDKCDCKKDPCRHHDDDCCDRRPDKCHCEKDNCCRHDENCCDRKPDKCRCEKEPCCCHDNDYNHSDRCRCNSNDHCCCRKNCQHQIDECETNCGDWIPDSWGCGCEIPLPPLPPEPDDCCCNRNCCERSNYNYYDSGLFNLYNHQKAAMAYVPRIYFNCKNDIYNLCTALERGTLFKELDKPFKGGQCR